MAAIERFEDIQSWQKGRELCKIVYDATRNEPFSRDWGLRDQIRRAAISIVSNIAEGFESQSNRTFIRYLYIAKASCGEVRAQAYAALDQQYITQPEFDTIYAKSTEVGKLLGGFLLSRIHQTEQAIPARDEILVQKATILEDRPYLAKHPDR